MTPDPDDPPRFWLPTHRALTFDECRMMAAACPVDWLAEACRAMLEWSLPTPHGADYAGLNRGYQVQQHDAASRPRRRT